MLAACTCACARVNTASLDGSINIECTVIVAEPLLETVAYCMNEEVKFTELQPHWSTEAQQRSDWRVCLSTPDCNFNVVLNGNY